MDQGVPLQALVLLANRTGSDSRRHRPCGGPHAAEELSPQYARIHCSAAGERFFQESLIRVPVCTFCYLLLILTTRFMFRDLIRHPWFSDFGIRDLNDAVIVRLLITLPLPRNCYVFEINTVTMLRLNFKNVTLGDVFLGLLRPNGTFLK